MVTNIATNMQPNPETNIDVVCGMKVEEGQAAGTSEYLGRTYYFCSEDCKHKFEQQPEFYIVKTGAGASGAPNLDEPL